MTSITEQNPSAVLQGAARALPALTLPQYSRPQILGIFLLGSAPMWVLAWLVYPLLSRGLTVVDSGLLLMKLLTLGLVWQFVLALMLLFRETGSLRLSTLAQRSWLLGPVSPKTGQRNNRLWWLLVPFMLLNVALELGFSPLLNDLWVRLLPFLAEPASHSLEGLFAPELRAQWVGAWHLFALFMVSSLFNTFLGEELLFRGLLLPRMRGAFGKWDWIANGVLFALYHLHMPWSIPGNILFGCMMALIGKSYRSTWFPVILHSGQAFFFGFIILGLVLGLA